MTNGQGVHETSENALKSGIPYITHLSLSFFLPCISDPFSLIISPLSFPSFNVGHFPLSQCSQASAWLTERQTNSWSVESWNGQLTNSKFLQITFVIIYSIFWQSFDMGDYDRPICKQAKFSVKKFS